MINSKPLSNQSTTVAVGARGDIKMEKKNKIEEDEEKITIRK